MITWEINQNVLINYIKWYNDYNSRLSHNAVYLLDLCISIEWRRIIIHPFDIQFLGYHARILDFRVNLMFIWHKLTLNIPQPICLIIMCKIFALVDLCHRVTSDKCCHYFIYWKNYLVKGNSSWTCHFRRNYTIKSSKYWSWVANVVGILCYNRTCKIFNLDNGRWKRFF